MKKPLFNLEDDEVDIARRMEYGTPMIPEVPDSLTVDFASSFLDMDRYEDSTRSTPSGAPSSGSPSASTLNQQYVEHDEAGAICVEEQDRVTGLCRISSDCLVVWHAAE